MVLLSSLEWATDGIMLEILLDDLTPSFVRLVVGKSLTFMLLFSVCARSGKGTVESYHTAPRRS